MSRIRKGTRSLKGTSKVVVKTSGASLRQLQCPRCRNNCTPVIGADMRAVYRCVCGRTFSPQSM
jgi:hypothetical protein